ncbi:hypothetical protein [Bifidobacterium aerophilum]|uniref:Uncharacterized protein n=1 Tax=Bifidobacterium aerophilum TaxID=1798155 RepID=A0A6N9Z232_9BIFI|nr:hypothetical protein [Bifidobacterium aerophilum]NEG88608.1 hypothetical protein [Bifidobacterium aerophilum]
MSTNTFTETRNPDGTTTMHVNDTMQAKLSFAKATHALAEEAALIDLEAKCRAADALAAIADALTARNDGE